MLVFLVFILAKQTVDEKGARSIGTTSLGRKDCHHSEIRKQGQDSNDKVSDSITCMKWNSYRHFRATMTGATGLSKHEATVSFDFRFYFLIT